MMLWMLLLWLTSWVVDKHSDHANEPGLMAVDGGRNRARHEGGRVVARHSDKGLEAGHYYYHQFDTVKYSTLFSRVVYVTLYLHIVWVTGNTSPSLLGHILNYRTLQDSLPKIAVVRSIPFQIPQ